MAQSLGDKGILVIPLSMILFSLGGSTFGMSEEVIPLFAVFVSLMFSLGFDSMTAILILFLGTQAGYIGSTINPFNVLIAQGVADVHGNPLLVYRVVCWAVITLISILFTMHYAKKSRPIQNPLLFIKMTKRLSTSFKILKWTNHLVRVINGSLAASLLG